MKTTFSKQPVRNQPFLSGQLNVTKRISPETSSSTECYTACHFGVQKALRSSLSKKPRLLLSELCWQGWGHAARCPCPVQSWRLTTACHWKSGQICQIMAKGQELVPGQKSGMEREELCLTQWDFHRHWPDCPARWSISAWSSNSPSVHWRLQHLPRNVKNSKSRITISHFPTEKKISVKVAAAPCPWSHLMEHEKPERCGRRKQTSWLQPCESASRTSPYSFSKTGSLIPKNDHSLVWFMFFIVLHLSYHCSPWNSPLGRNTPQPWQDGYVIYPTSLKLLQQRKDTASQNAAGTHRSGSKRTRDFLQKEYTHTYFCKTVVGGILKNP